MTWTKTENYKIKDNYNLSVFTFFGSGLRYYIFDECSKFIILLMNIMKQVVKRVKKKNNMTKQ